MVKSPSIVGFSTWPSNDSSISEFCVYIYYIYIYKWRWGIWFISLPPPPPPPPRGGMWKGFYMMTSLNENIFRVTGPLYGEFTGHRWIPSQRPVTQRFGVFFDLRLNKRLSKQSWRRWFETHSRSLWRHCNDKRVFQTRLANWWKQS